MSLDNHYNHYQFVKKRASFSGVKRSGSRIKRANRYSLRFTVQCYISFHQTEFITPVTIATIVTIATPRHLATKAAPGCEAAPVLVGKLAFLENTLMGMIRLAHGQVLGKE